jgi:hypothetical protein
MTTTTTTLKAAYVAELAAAAKLISTVMSAVAIAQADAGEDSRPVTAAQVLDAIQAELIERS